MMTCFFRARGGCWGGVHQHHWVQAQRLKRNHHHAHLRDPRNLSPVCHFHHGMLTARMMPVDRSELPAAAEEFADEVGMGWSLDVDYGSRDRELA